MTATSPSVAHGRLHDLGPGVVAATSFAIADVVGKVALIDGTDVLTLSTFRGVMSVVFMFIWLRLAAPPAPCTPRQRWIALGIGVVFSGIVFGLFEAISRTTVAIGVLTYFAYPLLTGIVAGLMGIEKLSLRGVAIALVAFLGLALTVGAQPEGVALAGIAFALGAAGCRVIVLLATRMLLQGVDARLTTWYSLLSSGAVFVVISLAKWHWQSPATTVGWIALIALSASTLIAVLLLFVSINRIGPFRSAVIMNFEPLLATVISVPVLGEILSPLQMVGGIIMLAALVVFQLKR